MSIISLLKVITSARSYFVGSSKPLFCSAIFLLMLPPLECGKLERLFFDDERYFTRCFLLLLLLFHLLMSFGNEIRIRAAIVSDNGLLWIGLGDFLSCRRINVNMLGVVCDIYGKGRENDRNNKLVWYF